MMGAFVGPEGVFAVVLISSVLGSVLGVSWALVQRRRGQSGTVMKASIPYGPFLVVGALYYYLVGGIPWLQSMTPT